MEPFWNKKYLKIVYHSVLFVALAYLACIIVNYLVASVTDLSMFFASIGNFIGKIVNVFQPLVIAVIFAFLFEPLVAKFQLLYEKLIHDKIGLKRKNKNIIVKDGVELKTRAAGALGTILVFYGIIVLIIRSFFMIILDGAKSVVGIGSITNQSISNYFNEAISFLDAKVLVVQEQLETFGLGEYGDKIVDFLYSLIEALINLVSSVALNLGTLIMGISSSVVLLFISTVLAFYVMKDKEILVHKGRKFFKLFLPNRAHKLFHGLFVDIITVFSGYVRGMLVDVSVIAMMVSGALTLIGIPYALIIGIISGFANFIPYLGSFTAAVLAITSAALTGDITKVVLATIAVIIIQQIDSYVVVPKALGQSVELSPLLVLLSLSVAGNLFGLVGMIIAVPTTALIKIIIERLVQNEEQYGSVQKFYAKFRRNKEHKEQ